MNDRRTARVRTLLREEIASILRREMRDPRMERVSISEVEVTRDLKYGRVFVTYLGDEVEREAAIVSLNRAAAWIRNLLGRRVHLKHVPELTFQYDTATENGMHVHELLRRIAEEEGD